MKTYSHYEILAGLFDYPDENFRTRLQEILNAVQADFQQYSYLVQQYASATENLSLHELEEYYLNTFLLNAVSSLDIGFVLFGEDYKRNIFLSQMQLEQNKAGNDCGVELADHLPNVLRLLPKLEKDFREEFSWCLLLPAVSEICLKFSTTDNFYYELFYLLENILKDDFGHCTLEQFVIRKKEKVEYE